MAELLPFLNKETQKEESTFRKEVIGALVDTSKHLGILTDVSTSTTTELSTFGKSISDGLTKLMEGILGLTDITDKNFKLNENQVKKNVPKAEEAKTENGRKPKASGSTFDAVKDFSLSLPKMLDSIYNQILNPGLFLSTFLGSLGGTAGISKLLTPKLLGFVGATIGFAFDGITGYFKSGDFNTTGLSAALSSMITGAGDKGILDTFVNMGKWAAAGAAVGSVVPVIGTIAGGILGAAIGALTAQINTDWLASKFDAIGNWFGRSVDGIFGTDFVLNTKDIDERKKAAQEKLNSLSTGLIDIQNKLSEKQAELIAAKQSGDSVLIESVQSQVDSLKTQLSENKRITEIEKGKLESALEDSKTSQLVGMDRFIFGVKEFFTYGIDAEDVSSWFSEKYVGMSKAWDDFKVNFSRFLTGAGNLLDAYWTPTKKFMIDSSSSFTKYADEKMTQVNAHAGKIASQLRDKLKNMFWDIVKYFDDIIDGVKNWFSETFTFENLKNQIMGYDEKTKPADINSGVLPDSATDMQKANKTLNDITTPIDNTLRKFEDSLYNFFGLDDTSTRVLREKRMNDALELNKPEEGRGNPFDSLNNSLDKSLMNKDSITPKLKLLKEVTGESEKIKKAQEAAILSQTNINNNRSVSSATQNISHVFVRASADDKGLIFR